MDSSEDDEPAPDNAFCVPEGVERGQARVMGCVCLAFVWLMLMFMIGMLIYSFTR